MENVGKNLMAKKRKIIMTPEAAHKVNPAVLDNREEDANWAQHDPQVEERYGGQWVVAYQRKIVAHGTDATAVLGEAVRLTQRPPEELLVCAIPHSHSWLAEA